MRAAIGYERARFAWVLNSPALIAIFVLAAYPIVYSAWISLHKYNLKRPHVFEFIGLDNYARILDSTEFWSALWITVQFTVLVVARRLQQLIKGSELYIIKNAAHWPQWEQPEEHDRVVTEFLAK
jgi:ABC-type sugar transport system permease subunit